MWRALLFFALALGVVLGGLFLLRRTANTPIPKLPRNEDQDKEKDEDENGW
jgi:DUF2897 family protein